MKNEWRRILQHRSVKDKIGIARDCQLCPVDDLPIVAELVREGIMVHIDQTTLTHLVRIGPGRVAVGVSTDIYQLTLKGIKLCKRYGIDQQ